jgi:hypothetical protein
MKLSYNHVKLKIKLEAAAFDGINDICEDASLIESSIYDGLISSPSDKIDKDLVATPALLSHIRSGRWNPVSNLIINDEVSQELIGKLKNIRETISAENNIELCKLKHLRSLVDDEVKYYSSHLENATKHTYYVKTAYQRFIMREMYGNDSYLELGNIEPTRKISTKLNRTLKGIIKHSDIIKEN